MESLQLLDQILAFFDGALSTALPILDGSVRFVFQSFLVIAIVFAGAAYAFGSTSIGVELLLKKILLVTSAVFLLTNWIAFTNIIINSFALLGLRTGGVSAVQLDVADLFEPSRIAGAGVGLADQLLERTNEVNLFSFDFGTLALLFVAALVLGLSFILIALQVFILLIEFKLVTLGGFILIPFALLDRTTSMAQGALGYVISAGLKVFVIAVVVSFALAFVEGITLSEEEPNVSEAFTAIGVSLTFLMLAIRAPGLAASMVSGGPQLGVGAIAQTVGTAVGAGMAAAFGTAATFRAAGAVGSLTARAQQHLQGHASSRSPGGGGASVGSAAGRSSASTGTSLAVGSGGAGRASPRGGSGPTPARDGTPSSVRSDLRAAGRDLGRAGIAAGVALPRGGDGDGGSVSVDLSDKK